MEEKAGPNIFKQEGQGLLCEEQRLWIDDFSNFSNMELIQYKQQMINMKITFILFFFNYFQLYLSEELFVSA